MDMRKKRGKNMNKCHQNTSFIVARIDALLALQAQQKQVGGKRHISKAGQDGTSFQKELNKAIEKQRGGWL